MAAIRSAAGGDARVSSEASDDYPIVLTVRTSDGLVLWRGSQKKLYRKYAADRARSMEEISQAVREYLSEYKQQS